MAGECHLAGECAPCTRLSGTVSDHSRHRRGPGRTFRALSQVQRGKYELIFRLTGGGEPCCGVQGLPFANRDRVLTLDLPRMQTEQNCLFGDDARVMGAVNHTTAVRMRDQSSEGLTSEGENPSELRHNQITPANVF